MGVLIISVAPLLVFAQGGNNSAIVQSIKENIPPSEIYQISINNDWKITSLVKFDENNFYIPVKFLPEKFLKLLNDEHKKKNLVGSLSLINKIDREQLLLSISLDSSYFNSVVVSLDDEKEQVESNPINAALLNYSINTPLDDFSSIKGTYDLKWSSKQNWNLSNGFAWDGERNIRLNSYFQKKLDNNDILTIGDTSNNAISGLNSVNFAGFRLTSTYYNEIDSNNNTPILPISGFSVNPTKLDLYMNNQLVNKTEINSGNYELQQLLKQNGFGVAQAYVYDINGVPQIVTVPFYGSNEIIREGTSAYDISTGVIRKNLGLQSFNYSDLIVNALYKKGITKNYTQDFFFQYTNDFQVLSTISHWIPNPYFGKVGLGINLNSENQKSYYLSWDKNTPNLSFNANTQRSSLFCSGLEQSCFKEKTQLSMSANLPKKWGQVNLNYIRRDLSIYSDDTISASWKKQISPSVNLITSISKSFMEKDQTQNSNLSAYIGLSIALGSVQSNSTLNHSRGSNSHSQSFTISEDQDKPHYGYGSFIFDNASSGNKNMALNYSANLDHFSYNIYGNKNNNGSNFSGNLNGSMVYVPEYNSLTFNKKIENRFTFLKVNGTQQPIPVSQGSKKYTTNKNGNKVLTESASNITENVNIDVNKLPRKIAANKVNAKYSVPFSYGNKVELSVKSFPRNITISGVEEGTTFKINDDIFVVGKNGKTSIDVFGKASVRNKNGKLCELDFTERQKTYECN